MADVQQDLPPSSSRTANRLRLTRRRFLQTLGGAGLLGTGTLGYASLIEIHRLVVERITIPIPGLAARWHGRRLVQLSDFHAGRTTRSNQFALR